MFVFEQDQPKFGPDPYQPTTPRAPTAASYKGPGPGELNLPTLTGRDSHDPRKKRGPAFTIQPRRPEPGVFKGPGPGHYDPKFNETGKQFTMGKRTAFKGGDENPGPGTYDVPNRHSGPKFSHGVRREMGFTDKVSKNAIKSNSTISST